jgi:DNA repair protein RecO (recombination protein O)
VPHVTLDAVCVRHWDFSETSQTVSLFSRENGLLRGLAKGAKRAGGRFSGGIDLLTRGQVVAIVKPGRELATLTDWTLLRSWRAIRHDLAANQAAYYLADLVQRMVGQADPHPRLYDALLAALDALETRGAAAAATLSFQWTIVSELGHRPRFHGEALPAAPTVRFRPEDGSLAADGEPQGWKVRRGTVELLASLGDELPANLVALRSAEPESLGRANRLLAAYLRHLLGVQPETMRLLFPNLTER